MRRTRCRRADPLRRRRAAVGRKQRPDDQIELFDTTSGHDFVAAPYHLIEHEQYTITSTLGADGAVFVIRGDTATLPIPANCSTPGLWHLTRAVEGIDPTAGTVSAFAALPEPNFVLSAVATLDGSVVAAGGAPCGGAMAFPYFTSSSACRPAERRDPRAQRGAHAVRAGASYNGSYVDSLARGAPFRHSTPLHCDCDRRTRPDSRASRQSCPKGAIRPSYAPPPDVSCARVLSRRSSSFGRLFLWIAQLAVWDSGCTDRAHPRNLVGRWIEVPTPARGAASAILFNADGTTEWLDPAFDGACTVRRMSGMRWRATSDHIFFSGVALTNCAAPVATTPTPLWGPHATGGETSSPYVIERDGRLLLEFPSLSGSLRMGQHFRRAP